MDTIPNVHDPDFTHLLKLLHVYLLFEIELNPPFFIHCDMSQTLPKFFDPTWQNIGHNSPHVLKMSGCPSGSALVN